MVAKLRIWGTVAEHSTNSPTVNALLCGDHEDGTPWCMSSRRVIKLIETDLREFYIHVNNNDLKVKVQTTGLGEKQLVCGNGHKDAVNILALLCSR